MALTRKLSLMWHRRCLPILCACALAAGLLWPDAVFAAVAEEVPPAGKQEVVEYPDLEQLVPMSTVMAMEAADAKNQVAKGSDLGTVVAQIEENQQTLLFLDQKLSGWGPLAKWSEGRLLGALQRLTTLQGRQQAQLDKLAVPFKAIEELNQLWMQKQAFWSGWHKSLIREHTKFPAETFAKNRTLTEEIVLRSNAALASLTEIQQKLSAQQEVVSNWLVQVNDALNKLHGPLSERNAPVLFSRDYFGEFNDSLWAGLNADIDNTTQIPGDFASREGWVSIVQLLLILGISWQLYQRARAPEPVQDKWQFLFRHPVAGGLFIGLIGGSFFYTSPPPLWRWVQLVFGTIAATILICAMLERPRLRRVIITLAVLFVCSSTIQMVGLVQPLHRLFLLMVCAIATPLCLAAARRQRRRKEGRVDLLAFAFYLGTLAGGIGLVAEIVGYANLTAYLVYALLGTTFIYLFARMALHIGTGAIDTLLETEAISQRRLVRRLGPETETRLVGLLRVIIFIYALLYLLVRWRVYTTPKAAWDGILSLTFKIGEMQVSMEILLMVACVLYLSLILSWIIQALLDAEILSPKGMEYGVKVAIKTLIHYSLILIGFLVAVSVAGIDMSKFAILAGAFGVGIGFGLQNIVNNFLSGLILLFERPVKVGDMVSIDKQWGTITKIGLRSTVVETLDRSELIVPNSELIAQKVTNWTFTSNVSRIVLPVGVAYGTPLEDVLEVMLQAARDHDEVLADPEPSAIFTGFGESSIDFELRVWVSDINERLRIRSELGLAVDRRFRSAGIVIPFPQRDLHLHSVPPTLQDGLPKCGSAAAEIKEGAIE